MAVRPRTAWFLFSLLPCAFSSFSLSGALMPSSQVSRAAFGLLRYGGMGGDAYRGVRKAGVEGLWELGRAERRHGPGRGRNRRRLALQVCPLVM
jgi:hypothetical protein